jgi:hypothetical protein
MDIQKALVVTDVTPSIQEDADILQTKKNLTAKPVL